MEYRLRPRVSWSFLQNNNHQAVKKMEFHFLNCLMIPSPVIPKTLKMLLDTSLLNTQQYKVRIKGKVEQSRERGSTLPYNSV